jgi:hypothetical protein
MTKFEKVAAVLLTIGVILIGVTALMFIIGVLIDILGFLFNYPWESIIAISSIYWIGAMIYNSNSDEFID